MKALIVVDVQNDFLPGGSLPVPRGDEVVPVANRLMRELGADAVVATQDWHPPSHASFASNHPGKQPFDVVELSAAFAANGCSVPPHQGLEQILWPNHCVQNSPGAEFAPGLETERFDRVFRKGTDPAVDSYSGFFDNGHQKSTGLGAWLKERGVREVVILGLALDVCVKYTALDARELGFATTLALDGCRGVDVHPGDSERALEQMKSAGVRVATSQDLIRRNETHADTD